MTSDSVVLDRSLPLSEPQIPPTIITKAVIPARQVWLQKGRKGHIWVGGGLEGWPLTPFDPFPALLFQWERLWFLLLTVTFGLTLTWLYFWWEVHNDYDEFNW